MNTLIDGVRKFHREVFSARPHLYENLAQQGQHPRILFITCSDARIEPEVITQTQPGELYVVRNAGNLIPPHDPTQTRPVSGEEASIEFAVSVLGVAQIVVCGHSHCGAIEHLLDAGTARGLSGHPNECSHSLAVWLRHGAPSLAALASGSDLGSLSVEDKVVRLSHLNICTQLAHLQTIPSVAEAVEAGRVTLSGWYYCLEKGTVEVLDAHSQQFIPVI
jgi:carbonic anhydrase